MSQVIYKYPLRVADEQEIEMPMGAELMTVQMQNGIPCLWALVNTDNTLVNRKIAIRGTGQPAAGLGPYILTFQMGGLVFHAFEIA